MRTPGVIAVGDRSSPFAVALMLACTFGGVAGLTTGDSALPFTELDLKLWYVGLIVGSLTSLIGIGWKDPVTGMLIERLGQFVLASLMYAYSAATLLLDHMGGPESAVTATVFGMACTARVIQIHVVARRIRTAVKVIDELSP